MLRRGGKFDVNLIEAIQIVWDDIWRILESNLRRLFFFRCRRWWFKLSLMYYDSLQKALQRRIKWKYSDSYRIPTYRQVVRFAYFTPVRIKRNEKWIMQFTRIFYSYDLFCLRKQSSYMKTHHLTHKLPD